MAPLWGLTFRQCIYDRVLAHAEMSTLCRGCCFVEVYLVVVVVAGEQLEVGNEVVHGKQLSNPTSLTERTIDKES